MPALKHLKIGCCTAVLDRPLFARLNRLQVATQTLAPDFHVILASGAGCDRRVLEDLLDRTTLFRTLPEGTPTLAAYAIGLKVLLDKGTDLFCCLDHDCLYYRDYLKVIRQFVRTRRLDIKRGDFCLNLIDQYWLKLYEDDRATLEPRSFHEGLGLAPEEAKRIKVGAPPTFVFGRRAAEVAIASASRDTAALNGFHDIVWRRALLEAGIQITQVKTPRPVFAYVRHRNNLVWGNAPVGQHGPGKANGNGDAGGHRPKVDHQIAEPSRLNRSSPVRWTGELEVSVVIPTFNEGTWLMRTVESIMRAKTELRYEIVVVNDGCTDGSVGPLDGADDVRIIGTGGSQLGLVIAKNLGAKTARGRYVCFLDSHMLVHDYWLDYLRQSYERYPAGALVSGNVPDIDRFTAPDEFDDNQYAYIIRNCFLGTGWHHYGRAKHAGPYLGPLTPGGLMFTRKLHFARLGGFDPALRKWGAEDVQISLQNFYLGGVSVIDPRVIVYHYFKNGSTKKRSFIITNEQHAFNCLQVAATYFPHEIYLKVREAFVQRGGGKPEIISEIEGEQTQQRIRHVQARFTRGFEQWVSHYRIELSKFLKDTQLAGPGLAARQISQAHADGIRV